MLVAACAVLLNCGDGANAQESQPLPHPVSSAAFGELISYPKTAPPTLALPGPAGDDRMLPISLPAALQLAGARPLDIAIASESVRIAEAQLQGARALWLPTIMMGTDYYRHDGQLQDVAGNVFGTSKSSFMLGAGPFAVFAISDAIFAPLAARQIVQAQQANLQAATNDSLLAVAEAYFGVQQARGDLASAEDAARRAEDVLNVTQKLVPTGLVARVEVARANAEVSRRRSLAFSAREKWRIVSADLARVLRLDNAAVVQPVEPPHLLLTLVAMDRTLDDLITFALLNRPELEAQQALVRATLERLRQEKMRPLIPSLMLRGVSTPVAGTLAGGLFGGGTNSTLSNFSARSDIDIQVVWVFENMGWGNLARIKERRADNQRAALQLFRVQDQVAAEVAQAFAQVRSASARLAETEKGVKDAVESADLNVAGLKGTKGPKDQLVLLVRPQEAVQSVQALAQAYADYYAAVADYDRAQFRLYRAMGRPAQMLTCTTEPNSAGTAPEAVNMDAGPMGAGRPPHAEPPATTPPMIRPATFGIPHALAH